MKFRKKPVVIEAVQFDGSNFNEMYVFGCPSGDPLKAKILLSDDPPKPGSTLTIETLEGNLKAQPGDFVIRGVKGEFYPCKPDIFAATYEPAEPSPSALRPLPSEATAPTPAEPILQFFAYAHLPPPMQEKSRPFCELADRVVATLPRNAERTVALRKLLEAKDAAVRASIAK